MDRFTHITLEFAENVELSSKATLQDMASNYRYAACIVCRGEEVVLGEGIGLGSRCSLFLQDAWFCEW